MQNFTYHNPTRVLFGRGQISAITDEIPVTAKILLTYGGGSIKNNGIYDQVKDALKHHTIFEANGIQPNPEYQHLIEMVDFVKREKIDFLLAVGGGSVIDGTKFISVAPYLANPWEDLIAQKPVSNCIPMGAVLTLPATGSETNPIFVLSHREEGDKRAFKHLPTYPKFAVLDPTVVASLPQRQIGNGVVDAFVHVMEQYLTYPVGAMVQDGLAETLLRTLIETGPTVLDDPQNYLACANFMWSASVALNGLLRSGVPQDWATHMIGHQLTALYGLDHAQTLGIIYPAVMRIQQQQKHDKLLQYARNVWHIEETDPQLCIDLAIAKTRNFFESLGVNTYLSDYNITQDLSETIAERLANQGMANLGEHQDVDGDKVKAILTLAK